MGNTLRREGVTLHRTKDRRYWAMIQGVRYTFGRVSRDPKALWFGRREGVPGHYALEGTLDKVVRATKLRAARESA